MTRGCEEAVRTLSASAQANVYIEAAHEGCDMNVKISRTRFEDLCFDLYKAASGVISKALAEAGSAPEKVDMVLLAGGERRLLGNALHVGRYRSLLDGTNGCW